MLAAHRTLPLGTRVLVQRLDTCQGVIVRIADRGPYYQSRIIDLMPHAADAIGLTHKEGLTMVKLSILEN